MKATHSDQPSADSPHPASSPGVHRPGAPERPGIPGQPSEPTQSVYPAPPERYSLSRRRLLLGSAALAITSVGAGAVALSSEQVRSRIPGVRGLGGEQALECIPAAPVGQLRLEKVQSGARGRVVDLFTAVPAGHGDGRGLPVVIVLHGASARPSDFQRFGFGQFVSHVSTVTGKPFVLAGATGDRLRWEPHPGDDPAAMVATELPQWLAQRGFDSSRKAVWGWSMGGYGVLRLAQTHPGFARAAAVFSPALAANDAVFTHLDALRTLPLGVWCGTDDAYLPVSQQLAQRLVPPPLVASFTPGGHTQQYWNCQTSAALTLLAQHL